MGRLCSTSLLIHESMHLESSRYSASPMTVLTVLMAVADRAVTVLGPWAMAPWTLQSFVDPAATWIWTDALGASQSAAVTGWSNPPRFMASYNSAATAAVTIYAAADNIAKITLNGNTVGRLFWGLPGSSGVYQFGATLQPGRNVFQVDVVNVGLWAGLLVTVVDPTSKAVLLHTDSSWTWQAETNTNWW